MMGGHSGVSSEEYSLYNDSTKKNKEVLYGKILNGGHFSINSISFTTTNLTHLKLSDCKLTQFPADIPNIESIIEIDLSKNLLQDLPDSFTTLKQLRVLNLSDNCISMVPSVFYQGLHLVKNLNISKNRLVTFQKPPCCLTFLSYLDLSFNKLVAPPPWLLEEIPSSLETVDLSFNPCFQLCPACPDSSQQVWRVLQVSDQVKTLKMNSCGFRGGINEKYLSNFKNVTHLDLGSTMRGQPNFISDISHLPETITDLSLQNSSLASFSKSITSLSNLRTLDISKNIIQWFPPAVKGLKNLVILRAESSKIFLIPPEMNELPNLKELYLSDNELNSSDGFEDLVTLEVLDLYGNQFITVPKFDNLQRLRALDFCQNYIEPPKLVTLGERVCSYESLKDCFRSKHLPMKIERLNGAKDFPVIPEIDDNFSDVDHLSEFDYYTDAEGSCEDGANGAQEVGKEGYASGTVEGTFSKETWELDSDDYFDPNAHRSTPMFLEKNSSATLTGELPYELTLHPHFFAPYKSVPPTDLPEDDLPPPVEGQFDD